jgi:hypothetical protein
MNRRGLISLALLLPLFVGCGEDDDGAGRSAADTPTPTATTPATTTATPTSTPDAPTASRTPSATRTATAVASPSPTPTATATATPTPTSTHTTTPADTATVTPTGTVTPTATVTATSTPTATPTATPLPPEITHFGVARSDDVPQAPSLIENGRPVYTRIFGSGLSLIVEARRGERGPLVGVQAFSAAGDLPDFQMLVSRALGDGSPEVCDFDPFDSSRTGGIPAVESLEFSSDPMVVAAVNDLGCRVNDGTGNALGRRSDPCTQTNGVFQTVDPRSEVQFCLPIARKWSFPIGDTIVATRVRDARGALSDVEEIVIRVIEGEPFDCFGLGERFITLARPASRFLGSAAGGADLSVDPWLEGPLRLCAGPDVGGGIHPLSLIEDAVLGFGLAAGETVCVKLVASTTRGVLDCNGGSALDVRVTQDLPEPAEIETRVGLDAGTGAAALSASVAIVRLPVGSSPQDCATADIVGGFRTELTTATASATVRNTIQGGDVSIAATGTNFDCDGWTETDGPGTFVFTFPEIDTPVGDTVNALVLAD